MRAHWGNALGILVADRIPMMPGETSPGMPYLINADPCPRDSNSQQCRVLRPGAIDSCPSLYSALSVEWYYCLANVTLCGALGAPYYLTRPLFTLCNLQNPLTSCPERTREGECLSLTPHSWRAESSVFYLCLTQLHP